MSDIARIHLYGELAEQFQPSYPLDARSPQEALHALVIMIPGFGDALSKGAYHCILGPDKDTGRKIERAASLSYPWRVGERDFHLVPAIAGAGRGGTKIIIGIAIIAIAIAAPYAAAAMAGEATPALGAALATTAVGETGSMLSITWGGIAFMGAMIALGGLAQAVSPQPTDNAANTQNSWLFNNLGNTAKEGSVIPYVYGEYLVGSVVISEGMQNQDIPVGVVTDAPGTGAIKAVLWNGVRST